LKSDGFYASAYWPINPFEYLSDYIQDLDQYYVEKLTNVLEYLKELKLVINNTRK